MCFFLEILFNVVFISFRLDVVCIAALRIINKQKKKRQTKKIIINLDGGEQLSSMQANMFLFLG